MSAPSISIAHLRWSTPDGRAVFADLDLAFGPERTGLIGRNGVGKSTLLKLIASELAPSGGRIIVDGKLGTLRQMVQVAPGDTLADLLGASEQLALLRRAEAGTATLDELANADWTLEARAAEALAEVGLDLPLDTPVSRLSGGERTRAALAGAVFCKPDFLLLDEPTNDLDREGRAAIAGLLRNWRAGAIVVSHDRELLEEMDAIVELTSQRASRYGGNWSQYRERKAIEQAATANDLAFAERRMSEVKRGAQKTVERKQRRDAAGSRKGARGDLPRIVIGTRRDRAEKTGGENARLADRQREGAAQALEAARMRIERTEPLSVTLASTGLHPSQPVLDVECVRFGYAPDAILFRELSFSVTGHERVAITGANGSGKSTLLRILDGSLTPLSGRARVHVPFAHFDQKVSLLDPDATIAENFARLNLGLGENGVRAALARFQFRAEAADRRVGSLSGGQMLRAGLACVLGSPAPTKLLILDEPTNHLDLNSIAAVESGLIGYDGALLVVSHDARFLDNIALTRTIDLSEH